MRNAILNRTYRNAGNAQARANVKGTDVLRTDLAGAIFHARHVVRHPAPACLVAKLRQAKQAQASEARLLESISSSMFPAQRWFAERGTGRAFVTSA
jgi:hypothetical protein